jgi:glycyl-tRNA synthetase (class II)
MPNDVVTMDKIVSLCKRRGFIFPASEIYGGIANTYDYGHYGVLLKQNVVAQWWKAMIQDRDDIVALDSAIIQHPRAWEASASAPTTSASSSAAAARPSTRARTRSATSPRRASST